MFLRSILAIAVLVGFSGCFVTQTTLPTKLTELEPLRFSVRMESIIAYGSSMRGTPTLCVSAPEAWKFEAHTYKGLSQAGALEGAPTVIQPRSMTHALPEGYVFTCWSGPEATYDLASHGKLRLQVVPAGVGPVQLTFVAGYDKTMNYSEFPQAVEVIAQGGE